MELGIYAELGILIGVATAVSLLMRFLRQPLIVGHIITGFLVARFALELFPNIETLELFSHLGVAFLLFSVGLNLNPKAIRDFGWVSVVSGFGQVILTGAAGVVVSLALGFDWITSLYLGVALAFSSTVIVLKLLADKGDLDKLYVRLSIGSLLLQDLIAIVLLFAIPFISGSEGDSLELLRTLALGIFAGVGVFMFAHHVVRRLHRYLSSSQELLFLFANAWGIGISILFTQIGFSLEGGALIAGVALSTLPSRHEIGARLTPLRDFFIVAFFVLLGTRMLVTDTSEIVVPAIVLSLFVLIINPLIQLIVMGFLGYRRKTSFQTGMVAAQISEFSLILVALGVSLGHVVPRALSVATMVGIITIFISSYLILYSDSIYRYVSPYLRIFERKNIKEKASRRQTHPVMLIGGGRIGFDFLSLFNKENLRYIVLDYDPETIKRLEKDHVPHEYGDANDPDLLEDMQIHQSDLVISTIPDLETNLVVLSCAKQENKGPTVIVVSHSISNALELYKAGADYVILPHFLGGKYAASLVGRLVKGTARLPSVRQSHIAQLESRAEAGQEHPQLERLR